MAEAVIVATSRTAIGRAGKGSFVDARPDDMSAFIIDDVLGKVPELLHDQVEDVIWGTAQHFLKNHCWGGFAVGHTSIFVVK